jgi:hypothetical protein
MRSDTANPTLGAEPRSPTPHARPMLAVPTCCKICFASGATVRTIAVVLFHEGAWKMVSGLQTTASVDRPELRMCFSASSLGKVRVLQTNQGRHFPVVAGPMVYIMKSSVLKIALVCACSVDNIQTGCIP